MTNIIDAKNILDKYNKKLEQKKKEKKEADREALKYMNSLCRDNLLVLKNFDQLSKFKLVSEDIKEFCEKYSSVVSTYTQEPHLFFVDADCGNIKDSHSLIFSINGAYARINHFVSWPMNIDDQVLAEGKITLTDDIKITFDGHNFDAVNYVPEFKRLLDNLIYEMNQLLLKIQEEE